MKVDPEFRRLVVPLAEKERALLERSIEKEGCRVPLDVWKEEDILLDGHNRLEICEARGAEYKVNYVSLPDRTAAKIWILENQAGRRNLSVSQLAVLALDLEKLYAAEAKKRQGTRTDISVESTEMLGLGEESGSKAAEKYGISPTAVKRAKTIKNRGVPELMDAVKSGEVTVVAGEMVSRLSPDTQKQVIRSGPTKTRQASTLIHDLSSAERSAPGITEKAVTKILNGEAATPKDAMHDGASLGTLVI